MQNLPRNHRKCQVYPKTRTIMQETESKLHRCNLLQMLSLWYGSSPIIWFEDTRIYRGMHRWNDKSEEKNPEDNKGYMWSETRCDRNVGEWQKKCWNAACASTKPIEHSDTSRSISKSTWSYNHSHVYIAINRSNTIHYCANISRNCIQPKLSITVNYVDSGSMKLMQSMSMNLDVWSVALLNVFSANSQRRVELGAEKVWDIIFFVSIHIFQIVILK